METVITQGGGAAERLTTGGLSCAHLTLLNMRIKAFP